MLTVKTILVPVDFGDSSDAAVRYALLLARRFEAAILVMHACDVPSYAYPPYPMVPISDLASSLESAAQKGLEVERARIAQEWTNVSAVLRTGKAWRAILEVATEQHVDLIVMGTHGREGLTHALLGSVAERVVRTSHVPVLTIRSAPTPAKAAKAEEDIVDDYEKSLARPSGAMIESATFSGAVAGMTVGAFAGPVGALVGGWVGTAVGAAASVAIDKEEARARVSTAQLDGDIGVIGGDIGAASPDLPPARVGAYSSGSAGVAPPAANAPSEGPMQDLSTHE